MKIEIFDRAGQVILAIPEKDWNLIFESGQAVDIANTILHAAQNCGADIKFEVEKPIVSEMQRLQMVARANHIMRSMQQVKDKNKVAVAIVDSILGTVL
jgi:hypothetical protein